MRHLTYHRCGGSGRYTVAENVFREHLGLIAGRSDVGVTFDDGHACQMRMAGLLEEFDLRGIFFITTGLLNREGRLTDDQIADLHRRGHRLGTHGKSHRLFTDLAPVELDEELSVSRDRLEGITGAPVRILSCPGGRFDSDILGACRKAGYREVYTSEPGTWRGDGDPVRIGRDAVLSNWSARAMSDWLSGRRDGWRSIRYRALDTVKKLAGDRIYGKLTVRGPDVD